MFASLFHYTLSLLTWNTNRGWRAQHIYTKVVYIVALVFNADWLFDDTSWDISQPYNWFHMRCMSKDYTG